MISLFHGFLNFIWCWNLAGKQGIKIGAQVFKRVPFLCNFPLCTKAQPCENRQGRALALDGMLQKKQQRNGRSTNRKYKGIFVCANGKRTQAKLEQIHSNTKFACDS